MQAATSGAHANPRNKKSNRTKCGWRQVWTNTTSVTPIKRISQASDSWLN